MTPAPPSSILILGLGNGSRGDAAAGHLVARRLRGEPLAGARVQEVGRDATPWIDVWKGATFVIVVGAVYSSERPGTIHRFDARSQQVPRGFFVDSNWTINLGEAIELARAFHRLPPRLILFGIVGKSFEGGADLCPAVQTAVEEVARRVCLEIHPPTEAGRPEPPEIRVFAGP